MGVLGRHRVVVAAGGGEAGHESVRPHGDGETLLRSEGDVADEERVQRVEHRREGRVRPAPTEQ